MTTGFIAIWQGIIPALSLTALQGTWTKTPPNQQAVVTLNGTQFTVIHVAVP